jgi:hypothetical protein
VAAAAGVPPLVNGQAAMMEYLHRLDFARSASGRLVMRRVTTSIMSQRMRSLRSRPVTGLHWPIIDHRLSPQLRCENNRFMSTNRFFGITVYDVTA